MKLLLKHLSLYLQHDIDVYHKKQALVAKIKSIDKYYRIALEWTPTPGRQPNFRDIYIDEIQPILYPVSSIIGGGGVGTFALWLYEQEPDSFDNLQGAQTWLELMIADDPLNLPFKIVDKLCSMHIDAFGLLEKGLAREKRNDGN